MSVPFRVYVQRSGSQRQDKRIIGWVAIVIRPATRFLETQVAIKCFGDAVSRPHFKKDVASVLRKRLPDKLGPDTPPPRRRIDGQVQDLQFIGDGTSEHQETDHPIGVEGHPTSRHAGRCRQETAIGRSVPLRRFRRRALDLDHPLDIPLLGFTNGNRHSPPSLRESHARSHGGNFDGNETRLETVSSLRIERESEACAANRARFFRFLMSALTVIICRRPFESEAPRYTRPWNSPRGSESSESPGENRQC